MTGINRTHYARTVVAPASRPAVTSLPDRQPVISRPRRRLRALPGAAICCGAVTGAIQAVSPLAFWWLEPRTVYALGLTLIAAVYIGLSVADGRWQVIAAESSVAGFFVVVAAVSVQRIGVADRAGAGWPRPEGPVAAPHSIRPQHALVATVLRHGRLGRRRNPHHRNIDGSSLPWLGNGTSASRASSWMWS